MQTAMAQHAEHAKAGNAALTGAGVPAITGVPLSDQAAETYLFAEGNVSSAGGHDRRAPSHGRGRPSGRGRAARDRPTAVCRDHG